MKLKMYVAIETSKTLTIRLQWKVVKIKCLLMNYHVGIGLGLGT